MSGQKEPLTLSFALWSMYQRFLNWMAHDEAAWGIMLFFSGAMLLLLGICAAYAVSTIVSYLGAK